MQKEKQMDLRQISDRIYYLPSSSETDRPVLGYIKGDRYSLMVDAGNSAKHVELFHEALRQKGFSIPDYVAITHWHWDHTFGMYAVNGKVIASRLTNLQLKKVMKWEWSDDAMKQRLKTGEDIEFCDRCIRLEYPDRTKIKVRMADIEFENELALDLGGVHCELKRIGGTHSEDSVSIYVPEEQTLFIGDADCEDHYYNNGKYNKSKLIELIDYLKRVEFDFYILGHDEPLRKGEVIKYLNEELAKL
jgi:glyoxylase-like metal-dependent hydrolase (beta-lactamase superfamily II)